MEDSAAEPATTEQDDASAAFSKHLEKSEKPMENMFQFMQNFVMNELQKQKEEFDSKLEDNAQVQDGRYRDLQKQLDYPEYHTKSLHFRRLAEMTRNTVAEAFQIIWGPAIYPYSIYFEGTPQNGVTFHKFKQAMEIHFEQLFQKKSELHLFSELRKKNTRQKKKKRQDIQLVDYINVDIDRVRTQRATMESELAAARKTDEADRAAELCAARATFTAFLPQIVASVNKLEQSVLAALKELVPSEAWGNYELDEQNINESSFLTSHAQLVQSLASIKKNNARIDELVQTIQDPRTNLFKKLMAASQRALRKGKTKSAPALLDREEPDSLLALDTLLQSLASKKASYDTLSSELRRVGQAAAILSRADLFNVFYDNHSPVRSETNKVIHEGAMDLDRLRTYIETARNSHDFKEETVETLRCLYDVMMEDVPQKRFVPARDYKSVLIEVDQPATSSHEAPVPVEVQAAETPAGLIRDKEGWYVPGYSICHKDRSHIHSAPPLSSSSSAVGNGEPSRPRQVRNVPEGPG